MSLKRRRDAPRAPARGRESSAVAHNCQRSCWPGSGGKKTSCIVSWKMAAAEVVSKSCLVQYVVVRTDLLLNLSWSVGAVISQACHAATAVIHLHYGDPDTQRYLAELDSMHKVVLGVSDQDTLYRTTVLLLILCSLPPTNTLIIILIRSIRRLCIA